MAKFNNLDNIEITKLQTICMSIYSAISIYSQQLGLIPQEIWWEIDVIVYWVKGSYFQENFNDLAEEKTNPPSWWNKLGAEKGQILPKLMGKFGWNSWRWKSKLGRG